MVFLLVEFSRRELLALLKRKRNAKVKEESCQKYTAMKKALSL
jgi:hypothetical protein